MIDTITSLDISTLGRFEVHRDHEALAGGNWSRRKVCDLFKVLLSADQHRLHREQIQEILWPSSTSEQAANSFGKTLYLLRRALEPDLTAGKGSSSVYVLLDHDTLMLVPDRLRIDADVFESSAKQLQIKMRSRSPVAEGQQEADAALLDEFDQVLALYKGDYLPEDLYEDWASRRRERLRRVHSWLLENAAELALAIAQGQRACEYLQALVERNSADEQTYRQLMLVYARMGRRSDALIQYQRLREALREELHANPLPETLELLRAIQAGRIAVDLGERRQGTGPFPGAGSGTIGSTERASVRVSVGLAGAGAGATRGEQDVASRETKEKGEEPQKVDEVGEVEEVDTQSPTDPDRILKAELVGREEEILRMQRAYNQTRTGQRRVVFLCGEPGIGKTRLAREFTRWGENTEQATVLWGYCHEMGGQLPYQPIADAISAHVRTCSPEQLRRMLGESTVDLAKIAPEVRVKLPELPQPEPLGPEVERRNLYNAVARYFNALVAERPLIIILDDLHWADAATFQLLSFLTLQSTGASPFDSGVVEAKPQARPLYLLLYRADEMHEAHPLRGLIAGLARGGMGEEMRLQRLSEPQVQQLLVNIAKQPVGPNFAAEVFRQTEGNPFFIGEAIRSLILEGKVKWTGERWQATVKPSELEIPNSVRLLIERRLVRLSPECRSTLVLAAVLGREFSSALLCQARNLSEDVVAEHIDTLVEAQLLAFLGETPPYVSAEKPSAAPAPLDDPWALSMSSRQDLDLAFTHGKIREVLYQWLNPLRRRGLHRQVGQAIEVRYAGRLQPYYSVLAHHLQMAEDSTRAVDYLLKATQHAISVYAYVNAVEYLKAMLELLIGDGERSRRAEVLRQLSDIYVYTGRPDKAIEAGLASSALWRALGEALKEADARLYVSFCHHWMGREVEAVEHIQHALKCIETVPEDISLRARACVQWSLAATVMGNVPLAHTKLQQADELHTQMGGNDAFISVVFLWAKSWYAFLAESPLDMLINAQRGAEACRTLHRQEWEPMMSYSTAWAYMLLGRLEEGTHMAQEALAQASRHNVVGAQAWANLVLAFLAIQAGRWEEAEQFGNTAYAIADLLHDTNLQARVLWSRSVCKGWLDNWEGAIVDITQALEMAKQQGESSMIYPHLLVQAAKSYFFAGKFEEAQHSLDVGMQLGESRHYRQLPAIGLRLQGRLWQAQGRFAEAQDCFERSLAALDALGDIVEHTRTEEAYAEFLLARNQGDDAERGRSLLESAKATFQRLGVRG